MQLNVKWMSAQLYWDSLYMLIYFRFTDRQKRRQLLAGPPYISLILILQTTKLLIYFGKCPDDQRATIKQEQQNRFVFANYCIAFKKKTF